MASYSVTAGNNAAHAKTLTGGAEDVVTFADNVSSVRVIVLAVASGAAPLYITGDGTTASAAAAKAFVLPAVVGAELDVELSGSTDEVHIFSAGAHTYSVEKG